MTRNEWKSSLASRDCLLTLSDPWDLGEAIQWSALGGTIRAVGIRPSGTFGREQEAMIIQLDTPFKFGEFDYEFVQGSPRYVDDELSSLLDISKDVLCTFVRIPEDQIESENPFDLNWWRGGGSFIGNLTLKSH